MVKNGSTLFLKTVVSLGSAVVLIFCGFLIKVLLTEDVGGYFYILIGMLAAAIPFFIGVYNVLKLLNLIDRKKAFTKNSVKYLNIIKYCGIAISTLYGLSLPYIFIVAERDDAPGVVLLGLIFTFSPMAVSIFAAVFQKLLQDAIDLKSENDLIV